MLGSNFSFSKLERKKLDEAIDDAIKNGKLDLVRYYNEIGLSKLKGNHNEVKQERIDTKYKALLIKNLNDNLIKIRNLKIEEIKNAPLECLTESEAKQVGKEEEWYILFYDVVRTYGRMLPFTPENEEFDYFSEEVKLQDKSDVTPKMIKDMYTRYHGKTFEEVKRNILKRQYKKAHK